MNHYLPPKCWTFRPSLLLPLTLLIGTCGCISPQSKSTATLIQDASGNLAVQLAANLTANQTPRIGILPLSENSGKAGSLAQALQESLKTKLYLTKRFNIIEDTDMQKVLGELRIQEHGEGILREDTIHRMGQLLGADAIVVGTITDLDSDFLVDCRLVPVTSGMVGSVAEVRIPKNTPLPNSPRTVDGNLNPDYSSGKTAPTYNYGSGQYSYPNPNSKPTYPSNPYGTPIRGRYHY